MCVALGAPGCAWTSGPLAGDARPVPETSQVLAADGSVVTDLHAGENRDAVPLAQIPKRLQDAVVAIEDERFWFHAGVDLRAVARAAVENASEGRVAEGGSTITQQYVKNELLGSERTVRRKVQEASLAYHLEQRYSKERILELYLNTIYFGNGAYGVEAAAREYFGVPVDDLDLAQAALIAGLISSPTTLDPYDHADRATARRRAVLEKMVELGTATRADADAAADAPLGLRTKPTDERYAAPYFVERVKRFILDDPRFGATPKDRRDLLFGGGLRIHTTLDLARQAQAEQAVANVLTEPAKDPEAALVAIEPDTGYVRAFVGGRHFFDGGAQGKFDLAAQGARPAGSSFKPFVLAAALEKRIALSKTYDAPSRLTLALGKSRQVWQVDNYEGGGGGRQNLVEATVQSTNTVYAQLIVDVGPKAAVDLAARMGVRSPLLPYESAVLGTNDVSPLDMAAAYSTFANRGVAVAPTFVTKVIGRDGEILYQHKHEERRVLDANVADTAVAVMRQVVERGTGVAAKIGRPVAGKTGTGQEWRDAWFVGFTPDLVSSVWVGFPDGQVSMVPPTTRTRVTGGSWPARIWQLFMGQALADVPVTDFHAPPQGAFGTTIDTTPRPVPTVVGMQVARAEELLSRDGFSIRVRTVVSTEYPPGYVTAQSPGGGAVAPGGSTVVVSVAGARRATTAVPDVLGKPRAQAVEALEAEGFDVEVVVDAEGDAARAAARPGVVWKQSPAAPGPADNGSTITVWVNPTDTPTTTAAG
jgi:penicillin-binding protein 1A